MPAPTISQTSSLRARQSRRRRSRRSHHARALGHDRRHLRHQLRYVTIFIYSRGAGARHLTGDAFGSADASRSSARPPTSRATPRSSRPPTWSRTCSPRAPCRCSTRPPRPSRPRSFSIPEFAPQGRQTPRALIDAVNAYEANLAGVDARRRLFFRERPTAALLEVGEWSGSSFQDGSTNSGEGLYSRVIVQGTGPDGAQIEVYVRPGDGEAQQRAPDTVPSPTAFETDTSGWTAVDGINRPLEHGLPGYLGTWLTADHEPQPLGLFRSTTTAIVTWCEGRTSAATLWRGASARQRSPDTTPLSVPRSAAKCSSTVSCWTRMTQPTSTDDAWPIVHYGFQRANQRHVCTDRSRLSTPSRA